MNRLVLEFAAGAAIDHREQERVFRDRPETLEEQRRVYVASGGAGDKLRG